MAKNQNQKKMKQWIIDNFFTGRARFMSFLGFVFVIVFLSINVWQIGNWNLSFHRHQMTPEVYERLVTGTLKDLFSIIMMIVAFYFRNDDLKPQKETHV
jgi:hypothetical protein